MKTFICLLLCLCMGIVSVSAESTRFGEGLFRCAEWGHSLYADEHPNFVRMDIPYTTNRPIYDYGASGESYHGNCPYGQFRNIKNFNQIGLCLIIE